MRRSGLSSRILCLRLRLRLRRGLRVRERWRERRRPRERGEVVCLCVALIAARGGQVHEKPLSRRTRLIARREIVLNKANCTPADCFSANVIMLNGVAVLCCDSAGKDQVFLL